MLKLVGLTLLFVTSLANALQVDTLTLVWHPSGAEVEETTLTEMKQGWEKGSIEMPFVRGESAEVNSRINNVLYSTLLDAHAPVKPGKTFSLPKGQAPEGISWMEFKVIRNDAAILEIQSIIEGCGAYCETYSQTMYFDVRSGRVISLQDLFTPKGRVIVSKKMIEEKNKLYHDQIRQLKNELVKAQKTNKQEEIEDTNKRIELNENCIRQNAMSDEEAENFFQYLKFNLPKRKGIVLIAERCGNHAERNLDDVGDVSFTVTQKECHQMLTPYGLTLLQGKRTQPSL